LQEEKVRGVVCSLNSPAKEQEAEVYNLTCDDNANNFGKGLTISIRCESTCVDSEKPIYMNSDSMFADDSKVCRAATYSGFGNENEAFNFKIEIRRADDFETVDGLKHKIKLTNMKTLKPSKGFYFDNRNA